MRGSHETRRASNAWWERVDQLLEEYPELVDEIGVDVLGYNKTAAFRHALSYRPMLNAGKREALRKYFDGGVRPDEDVAQINRESGALTEVNVALALLTDALDRLGGEIPKGLWSKELSDLHTAARHMHGMLTRTTARRNKP